MPEIYSGLTVEYDQQRLSLAVYDEYVSKCP